MMMLVVIAFDVNVIAFAKPPDDRPCGVEFQPTPSARSSRGRGTAQRRA
jgi:hypothetical protein